MRSFTSLLNRYCAPPPGCPNHDAVVPDSTGSGFNTSNFVYLSASEPSGNDRSSIGVPSGDVNIASRFPYRSIVAPNSFFGFTDVLGFLRPFCALTSV